MNPYREKLLSVTFGKPSDHPTQTKRNYYDADALKGIFPEDAKEQMMEATKGHGVFNSDDLTPQDMAFLAGEDLDDD